MSRSRRFPLIASLTALAVGSAPAWAQHHGGGRGGWPSQVRVDPSSSLPQLPGPPGGHEPRNGPMEIDVRSRPSANASDCSRSMALSPGDQVLSVQPIQSMGFGGRVQCRIKVMGADGMVRVMMVSPGF